MIRWLLLLGLGLAGLPAAGVGQSLDVERESRLRHLVAVYPEALERIDGATLVWRDGTRIPIDDGLGPKSPAHRLEKADIKDMLLETYPFGSASPLPTPDADPGRARNATFFDRMYGDCSKGQVQQALVAVVWLPRKWGRQLMITPKNGVAAQLQAISQELDALPSKFDKFLFPPAGTFNCRDIAGTTRKSAHGHGIAIDLAAAQSDYWRWVKPDATGNHAYRNRMPPEIVEVFERHGFIWGGKWRHFDTMHFEYRPELLPIKTR